MIAKAASDPTHIKFIQWSDIPRTGGNSSDGTHPTAQGAQLLADRVLLTL
jgi:lysophospholipase L1-like esterase